VVRTAIALTSSTEDGAAGCESITVQHNCIEEVGAHGLVLQGGRDVAIVQNTIRQAWNAALYATHVLDLTIHANRIFSCNAKCYTGTGLSGIADGQMVIEGNRGILPDGDVIVHLWDNVTTECYAGCAHETTNIVLRCEAYPGSSNQYSNENNRTDAIVQLHNAAETPQKMLQSAGFDVATANMHPMCNAMASQTRPENAVLAWNAHQQSVEWTSPSSPAAPATLATVASTPGILGATVRATLHTPTVCTLFIHFQDFQPDFIFPTEYTIPPHLFTTLDQILDIQGQWWTNGESPTEYEHFSFLPSLTARLQHCLARLPFSHHDAVLQGSPGWIEIVSQLPGEVQRYVKVQLFGLLRTSTEEGQAAKPAEKSAKQPAKKRRETKSKSDAGKNGRHDVRISIRYLRRVPT
jgi:hypothetical protein